MAKLQVEFQTRQVTTSDLAWNGKPMITGMATTKMYVEHVILENK